jgi:hypothetical protein
MTNSIEKIRKKYPRRLTRGRAIKLYCKENCCAGDMTSWKNCTIKSCFLWNFRLGKEIVENKKTSSKNDSMRIKNERKEGENGRE